MKRVVLRGPGELAVEGSDIPEPDEGQVLVDVRYCGICGSDVHSYLGSHPFVIYPVTPGHEFSGLVTAAGPGVDDGLVGSAVAVEPSLACGECGPCKTGRYNICENLLVMGFQAPGALCETIAVPSDRLHLLPDGVGFEAGALAEPAAVGVHALERSGARSGDSVLVIGAGVIGLMVALAAKAAGCRVACIEADMELAERALSFGADDALVWRDSLDAKAIRTFTAGGPRAVFECVGRPETIDLALRLAPRGSTVVVTGVFAGPTPVPLELVQDGEIDVKGTLMYTYDDFERALELIAARIVEPSRFVTHTFGLDEVTDAFELLAGRRERTLKVMIEVVRG